MHVCLGITVDLDRAVGCGIEAVSLTPDGDLDRPARLIGLGTSYRIRFDSLGELEDLNKSVECGIKAVSLIPDGHSDQPTALVTLGSSYRTRFKRLGQASDLDNAIDCGLKAVSLTPNGHPDRPTRLNDLGYSYQVRFERLGEVPDLNKAIQCGVEAVSLTPNGHSDKPGGLSNLGNSYRNRFERLGELSDLVTAIECGAKAVSLTPDGHPGRPARLLSLGISYKTRFERLHEIKDLDEAIECGVEAISLTPDNHPAKPGGLNNLGISYQTRFEHQGKLTDLNRTIDCKAEAVSLTPDDHPDRPAYLNNLGISHQARYERLGELSDLDRAIECENEAVSLTPNGHPDKSAYLFNLGLSYKMRFQRRGGDSDRRSAKESFKEAAQSFTGSPSCRFNACREWARFPFFDGAYAPHPAYRQAMELLPRLVWVGSTLGRRYEIIEELGDFATEAASYAISIYEYELALEWLEAGRSIVWGQISQLRTPFDQLFSENPDLANRLKNVAFKLEQAGSRSSSNAALGSDDRNLNQEASNHIQLALNWDNLIAEVRSMPGFDDFLRTPRSSQLLGAATSHPIALINAHKSRCDALIIRPNRNVISHVPLRGFSIGDASKAREQLVSLVGLRELARANKFRLHESALQTLWTGVVEPILDFLDYRHNLGLDELPQITWCTTGLLSFLPLHAAGYYDQTRPSAFDRVVSSYTPTLSALLAAKRTIPGTHHGILAVGQEHTPGLSSLPYTKAELANIRKHAPEDCYTQLERNEATMDHVLDAMDRSSWVHMACHGTQNAKDPTESAFHLHDGPLTLATITKRSFTNKGLAFLSACQTATGDKDMPDEAVHLAAGMLMAGYPSVVGTMWSIADQDGPEVADRVYAELLKDGKMDHTKAARALHRAVTHLRAKVGVKVFARWAPFIHIGS